MTGPRLSGVVEAGETRFRLSFKGRRKGVPRLRRRRGRKSQAQGASKEQVCVLTATDRRRGQVPPVRLPRAPVGRKSGRWSIRSTGTTRCL